MANVEVPLLPVPANSNLPYLIVIVVMATIGIAGTLAILVLRPEADNASLYVAIAGFVCPTMAAMLAFIKTQETHLLVNSRMDEFKKLLAINAATAEILAQERGIKQGLQQGSAK